MTAAPASQRPGDHLWPRGPSLPSPSSAPGRAAPACWNGSAPRPPNCCRPGARLTVHVVDPSPPGAGRVWRTAQSPRAADEHRGLAGDPLHRRQRGLRGPDPPGPSLYEWVAARGATAPWARTTTRPARSTAATWSGCSRRWCGARRTGDGPGAPRRARSVSTNARDGEQVAHPGATAQTGSTGCDRGRARPGPSAGLVPDAAEQRLAAYAERPRAALLPARQPGRRRPVAHRARASRSCCAASGLNFFDHMALLTAGRGGALRAGRRRRPGLSALGPRAAAVRGLPARRSVPRARRQREGGPRAAPSASADRPR